MHRRAYLGRLLSAGAAVALFASQAFAQTLAQQAQCAQQAKRMLHQLGWNVDTTRRDTDEWTVSLQSHYNPKLDKCFMVLETDGISGQGNVGTKDITLLDAYENRTYAEYMWAPNSGKKYWEVPPIICHLVASYDKQTTCHSEDEFNAFVVPYMGVSK
jgi:hypothetical protein